MEEMFSHFVKTSQIIESIVNECLGLSPNFLHEYDQGQSWDFMVAYQCNSLSEHRDGNCISFVVRDYAEGLEVCKGRVWISIVTTQGTIIVKVGDVIHVLNNSKFKSVNHRVVSTVGKSKFSYAFSYNLQGEKRVEPLPQFTEEIEEQPKYGGFLYQDYQAQRNKNNSNPPPRPEDVIHIIHYAITARPVK